MRISLPTLKKKYKSKQAKIYTKDAFFKNLADHIIMYTYIIIKALTNNYCIYMYVYI